MPTPLRQTIIVTALVLKSECFSALIAYGSDLCRRNVEKLKKLLMFLRRRAFELRVPAVHLLIAEPAGLHDGNPFLLRNHFSSP